MQFSFYADYLETFASSSEQRLDHVAKFYETLEWSSAELPTLYTPVNDIEIMREKRLIVLLWLSNEASDQEVIGYVNLKLDCLQRSGTVAKAKLTDL